MSITFGIQTAQSRPVQYDNEGDVIMELAAPVAMPQQNAQTATLGQVPEKKASPKVETLINLLDNVQNSYNFPEEIQLHAWGQLQDFLKAHPEMANLILSTDP